MKTIINCNIILIILILCFIGCGISTQSVDTMLNEANLQIDNAQKAEAGQYAPSEFDESKKFLQSALSAQSDEQKVVFAEKAKAKAILAEAIAKQIKTEKEADKLESELKIIEDRSNKVRTERQTVEEEFKQFSENQ